MNPTQSASRPNSGNLFEGIERRGEYEKPEVDNVSVSYTQEHRNEISNNWDSFYNLKTEEITEVVAETPVTRIELTETKLFESFDQPKTESAPENHFKDMITPENVKGSGSILEETGLKLDFPALGKEITHGLFGAFKIFKEIFMDTVTLVVGKKEKKKGKVETDPAKAKAAAEKKAENARKQGNIRAFYEGLKSQVTGTPIVEAERMDKAEKENINKTAKIGQESYKGIKDSFGRLTIYAASMFERAANEQENQAKKQEKEMKSASAGGAPDMNLDKAAEGGFLSSTGGQGAG